ncbi:hypothetical protein KY330_04500 [Candidatus Woesearchaeota archaeon]|nr:hypothetical protein [Candidatus Woesearchaeota archaeon]
MVIHFNRENLNDRRKRPNMLIEWELAPSSIVRGFRDNELIDFGLERIIQAKPGITVRKKDAQIPILAHERALYLLEQARRESCDPTATKAFEEYKEFLDTAEVYNPKVSGQIMGYLKKHAPNLCNRLLELDIHFIGRQNSDWLTMNYRYKDAKVHGMNDKTMTTRELEDSYKRSTLNLEKSIEAFKEVHGEGTSVDKMYERMQTIKGIANVQYSLSIIPKQRS